MEKAAAVEAKRAFDVSNFLSELGESPAPAIIQKRKPQPASTAAMLPPSSITATAIADPAQSRPNAKSLSKKPSHSSLIAVPLPPLIETSFDEYHAPPSPFLASISSDESPYRPNAALSSILAMGNSPDWAPVIAPKVASKVVSSVRVLGESRLTQDEGVRGRDREAQLMGPPKGITRKIARVGSGVTTKENEMPARGK